MEQEREIRMGWGYGVWVIFKPFNFVFYLYRMAPKKNYTPEQMGNAIEAVRKGEKIAKAAERFGVPRVTLHNKITGKSPLECSMGPATYLSKDEERVLELWVELMSEKHIPITKDARKDGLTAFKE